MIHAEHEMMGPYLSMDELRGKVFIGSFTSACSGIELKTMLIVTCTNKKMK